MINLCRIDDVVFILLNLFFLVFLMNVDECKLKMMKIRKVEYEEIERKN